LSTLPVIAIAQSRHQPSKFGKTTTLSLVKVFPAKQQRSEKTHEKLLQAGLDLLKNGIFEDISIAQISARAGCSVGSFYLRFRNKEAFFEFLIESISETLQAGVRSNLTEEKVKGLTLAQTVRLCVDHYVQTNRQYEGVIRAALQYSINGSDDWQPVRDNGLMLHAHYIDLIIAKLRRSDHEEARQQLLVGFQILSGHLINSIAHPVKTLPLDDPDLSHWLFELVMHCLKLKLPAPACPPQKKTRLRTVSLKKP
jgi:AcrR family transcriptional regulator